MACLTEISVTDQILRKFPTILGKVSMCQQLCTRLFFLHPRTRAWEQGYVPAWTWFSLNHQYVPLELYKELTVWLMNDSLIHSLSPESFWCVVRGYLGPCSMHCHCCHRREDSSTENISQDRWGLDFAYCSSARACENFVPQSTYLPGKQTIHIPVPRLPLFPFPYLMQQSLMEHSLIPRPS